MSIKQTSGGKTPASPKGLDKTPAGPPRRARTPAPLPGTQIEVNRFIAAYIMGVANRLANGASNYYRGRHDIGMSEWRAMMAIGTRGDLIGREVAEGADLDYAAASKSLKLLAERGLVQMELTQRRGRAAIARLTPAGLALYKKLHAAAERRERRLLAGFSADEIATLWSLLQRIESAVPAMNAGD